MGLEVSSARQDKAAVNGPIVNSTHSLTRGVKTLSRWLSRSHRKKRGISTPTYDGVSSIEASLNKNDNLKPSCQTPNYKGDTNSVEAIEIRQTERDMVLSVKPSNSILGKAKPHSQIHLLDETWEDWQEDYQKGVYNLSDVSRPICFNGFGHMTAPLHRNETMRLQVTEKFDNNDLWENIRPFINTSLKELLRKHRLKSATVSLLDQTTQKIMFQVGLGYKFEYLGRELSIDAHTILSTEYFALLDASSDWRTRLNPLVYGPPFIKFYVGVPIIYKSLPIGCMAILDPYLKTQVTPQLVAEMKQISQSLVSKLELNLETSKSWRNKKTAWEGVTSNNKCINSAIFSESKESLLSPIHQVSPLRSAQDRSDSDNSSNFSNTSTQNMSIFSISQESLVIPFTSHKTHLRPISSCRSILQPYEVFESLLRCPSITQAIKKACRMVMQTVGANAVYIAEVRILQKARIDDYNNSYDGQPVNEIERKTTVRRLSSPEIQSRLAGSCKPNVPVIVTDTFVESDLPLLKETIPSKYGLKFNFEDGDNDGQFMSGVMVPLRRSQPKFKQIGNLGEIQNGGFIMSVLSIKNRDFSPGDCAFIKKVTMALENILTCYDEIKLE